MAVAQQQHGFVFQVLCVDGGAATNDLLMQIQCDVLGVPVLRPLVTETTALGAACLAGVGAGVLDRETIEARRAVERRFEPAPDAALREAGYAQWRRAVQRSLGWIQT